MCKPKVCYPLPCPVPLHFEEKKNLNKLCFVISPKSTLTKCVFVHPKLKSHFSRYTFPVCPLSEEHKHTSKPSGRGDSFLDAGYPPFSSNLYFTVVKVKNEQSSVLGPNLAFVSWLSLADQQLASILQVVQVVGVQDIS